ncbi:MAG: ABC transporter permease subunit [Vicinamibacteria bacterium]|nr:ABC transporter permease subunit [Vicinamibacteria bacterium]
MKVAAVPWRTAARETFILSIAPLFRSPRYWIAATLLLLPALFGYERLLDSYFSLRLLPLAALILASALVAEDRERGTLVYLLTRPIDRRALLLGKYASYLVFMTAPALLAMTLGAPRSTAGVSAVLARLPRDFAVVTLALSSYGALFVLLGSLSKWPVIWGLLFLFIWEQIVLLPGVFPRLTIVAYVRQLLASNETASTTGSTGLCVSVLLAVSAAAFSAAAWVFSKREYASEPGPE